MAFEATKNEKPKAACRVIIVGCGLAGLATAIGIRMAGLQVLALEQAPELREVAVVCLGKYQLANTEQIDWSWY